MESAKKHAPFANGDRVAVDLGQHLDAGAVTLDPRRPDEHRPDRLGAEASHLELDLEAGDLAAEGVSGSHPVE